MRRRAGTALRRTGETPVPPSCTLLYAWRAALRVDKEGPALVLLDENGKPRAMLIVNKAGPGLDMLDENGKPVWQAP